jgi:sugar O-acyltransferase (sialic acid O-acetyltransferase NeuD family)
MSLHSLILIGGGGHCVSCIDIIRATGKYHIAGIIDHSKRIGESILGVPIIGNDEDLDSYKNRYDYFLVSVGQIHSPETRIHLYNRLKGLKVNLPTIVSPYAYVSPYSTIGEGTIVMHGAIVNVSASVGTNCIINSRALIEHETKIGNHCHLSTGSVCNGRVNVGEGSFIGSNATVCQNANIGDYAVVGAGAVVLNDVPPKTTFAGNPAKKIK